VAEVLVLSPHFDDAVLSCWHALASDRDVVVVNVFAAPPPSGTSPPRWDRITGATDSSARVRERTEEDAAALALADRTAILLEFVEQQYVGVLPAVEDVADALDPIDSDEVFAPVGIGGHSAHVLVRDAALRLDRRVTLYADIPYATAFGWPAWVTGAPRDPYLDVDADWEPAVEPLRAAGYLPRAIALAPDQQFRKAEAMRAYRTQFAALEAGGQRRLTHPELIAWEVVWERPQR
jgi:LmbE family N-acetylglucosaminyl deacetylase